MSGKFAIFPNYRWMVLTENGLLETPENHGSFIFDSSGYSSREEAIEKYQRYTDSGFSCPPRMVLVKEYSQRYVLED